MADTGGMPIGHLGVNLPDLVAARAYYDAVLPLLDHEEFLSRADEHSYRPTDGKVGTYLFLYPSQEAGDYSRHRTGLGHLAFIVGSWDAVHAVHDVVRRLGSEVVHEPQEWPEYHPGYDAVFWLDPFGQLLEAVCHRPDGGTVG